MIRFRAILAAALLAASSPALASQATLVTPSGPLPMTGLASFLNAGLAALNSCNSGTSAPSVGGQPLAGQCWANTTANPWVFSYYDGASWGSFGALNTSTHLWTPYLNGTAITGGALGIGNLASIAANSFVGTPGGSAAPSAFTIDGLTLKASPAAGDEIICWDVSGAALKKCTVSSIGTSSGASSVSNSDSSLTISPTTGAIVASINLAHANTWTANQVITNNNNGAASFTFNNNSGGTLAAAGIVTSNGTATGAFATAGTGYTNIPIFQNRTYMYSSGGSGIAIDASGGGTPIILSTNDIERCRVDLVLKCGTALFGGIPRLDVTSGLQSCAVADNAFGVDATSAIQCYLNYMNSTYGGGTVFVPPGNYKIATVGGLLIKGAVQLEGNDQASTALTGVGDIKVVTFDTDVGSGGTCKRAPALKSISVFGYFNVAATQDTVTVDTNCPAIIRDVTIWGGANALREKGVDGFIENVFACGYSAAVYSTGANWYVRDKFDTCGISSTYAFLQGIPTALAENHISQSDFSGSYTFSISIDDGGANQNLTTIDTSVFSSPVSIAHGKATIFSANEFGSSIASASPIILSGNYSFGAVSVSGAGARSCAANISITC